MSGADSGDRIAAAALAAVGTRFRLHGRVAGGDGGNGGGGGLDCVGLVAHALAEGGWAGEVPTGYALRGGGDRVSALLDAHLARADGERPGDVLLAVPGPAQLHLAIRTAGGLVHADAALRRVVLRPGPSPWPIIGGWRMCRQGG